MRYFLLGILLWPLAVHAVTLEQIISREDPKFNCAIAQLTIGRDGNVYLASPYYPGYVLRIGRDGTAKIGFDATGMLQNATANPAGIIATAYAHFTHAVNLYDRDFKSIGGCNEFLVNDKVQWDAPGHVEAGPSGDFYGIDQHRQRILRINSTGKIVQAYAFPATIQASDFRVCEADAAFDLLSRDNTLHCVGFDGVERWTLKLTGPFDVDPAGIVYTVAGAALQRFGVDGKLLGHVALPAAQITGVSGIGVFGDELILKRTDPTELFRVYDLASGQLKRVVQTNHERFSADFPSVVWTAGERLPFTVEFSKPGPQCHVWACRLGDSDWRELEWSNGQITVPVDYAGLYQLKIAPGLNPQANPEYILREVIEVRAPASRGTVSVWTPLNRIWFGRGEEIPVSVSVRTTNAIPEKLKLELRTATGTVWSTNVSSGSVSLPGSFTAKLAPGRYALQPEVEGFTCVAQPIRIGPGLAARSPFRMTRYGDYESFVSYATVWDFADTADDMLGWVQTLGLNQLVNRTFVGRYPLTFANSSDGLGMEADLKTRLAADPSGVATQKVAFGFAQAHTLGAYGAQGIREMLLLVSMDAALPIGTSTSYLAGQTPEQYDAEIKSYDDKVTTFPGFYGWTWVANWWVTDPSLAFESPAQKTEYEAALKKANETGAWDPVLDTVGNRKINWQVEAQELFRKALTGAATNMTTASSGPYRRPEVYPPTSFANVDEVDLHFQAEQITCPDWTAHATDFYKRPGKPAWIHPELFNDSGTGEQILPMTWLAVMRGVDGIGTSGGIPNWGALPTDPRSGYPGLPSVFRALGEFSRQYGPWLTTLQNKDRVAIVVSRRQIEVDAWGGIGGRYFTRLWEAFTTCLYARQPATFLYTEDVGPATLKQFKALLVIGQQYEMEPALAGLLAQAKKRGLAIFADGTCRESLVKDYASLGIAFDHIEKFNSFNMDYAYWQFPEVLLANAPVVARVLGKIVRPVAVCDQPSVLLSKRRSGDARLIWAVNNTFPALDPGLLWRVQNGVASCAPVIAKLKLPVKKGQVVYDVFSRRLVNAEPTADLRYSDARLYAILPRAIKSLSLRAPRHLKNGQTFTWTASIPGLKAGLPLHVQLRDGNDALIEERFTTTGTGTFTVPVNAIRPVTLSATELISGKSAAVGQRNEAAPTVSLDQLFGPRLRDIAVARDGKTALFNAFDWGQNLYSVDLATGQQLWTGNVGDYFAYAPEAAGDGFVAQGYDLHSGEGFHLYAMDRSGKVQRRFALPGLPARTTRWAMSPMLNERLNNFAAAPDGTWIAAAGDLGLAVWTADGHLLWSQDWSATSRETRLLLASGNGTLMAANDMTVTAYDARSGRSLWDVSLASTGQILGLSDSADGQTLAVRTSTQSGRVYLVRAGKIVGMLPTAADEAAVSPDGSRVAVTTGRELKWYAADGGLQWVFRGDTTLRFPRLSADGKRIAVSSELGTLYVLDSAGRGRRQRDLGAIGVPAWLPDGDLVLATWMGTVCRLDGELKEKWRVQLKGSQSSLASALVPTTRVTSWVNAATTVLPLTPNLIVSNAVIVRAMVGPRETPLENPAAMLFDGQTNAPAKPWVSWDNASMIDSGWLGSFSLEIDTFRTQLHVTAITFVEDPAHPESWLRDARLEYWDPVAEKWVFAQYLTADAPVHTHQLVKPIEAARFRLTRPAGAGWPVGNLRLAEIVFHGKTLGASHPDIIQNKPVAVLFDERESDLATMLRTVFVHGGAFHGGTYIRVESANTGAPNYQPAFGHAIPNWDFEIVEKPEKPGQYRWLEFAYKALAPETRGVGLLIGREYPGGGVLLDMGEPIKQNEGIMVRKQMSAVAAKEWTVVKVDLWEAVKHDFPIRCLILGAVGGPAGFDWIRLARTEADLSTP